MEKPTYRHVSDMLRAFSKKILQLFNTFAAVTSVKINENSHPCITSTVQQMTKLRDEAHFMIRRAKVDAHKKIYKELKSTVNVAI